MRKNIRVFVAQQIQLPARRQKPETRFGDVQPVFAAQQGFEFFP